MNSPEIIPGTLLKNTFVFFIFQISPNIQILEYSRNIPFLFLIPMIVNPKLLCPNSDFDSSDF
jgi:hypothetical protein